MTTMRAGRAESGMGLMKNIADLPRALPRTDGKKLVRVTGLPAVAALFATAPGRVGKVFFDQRAKSRVGAFCAVLARAPKPHRLVRSGEIPPHRPYSLSCG